MKITIDTKEDSPTEIKRVITMLQHLVGEGARTNAPRNIFEDDTPILAGSEPTEESSEPTNAFANMFGSAPTTPSTDEETETIDLDEDDSEETKEVPEIMEY
jgi:hypothetical protein